MKLPINYETSHWSLRKKARELYVIMQKGLCCHCGSNLSDKASDEMMRKNINKNLFPVNFFNYPIHLHHCHKTGMTIGAVHNQCNAVLWQYHGE